MRSERQILSGLFTELGQVLKPEEQQHFLKLLLEARDWRACRIVPHVLRPDGVGDELLDMDIPMAVHRFDEARNVFVMGEIYAVDYAKVRDVPEMDWRSAAELPINKRPKEAFMQYNKVTDDSEVSIVRLDPLSFFVGKVYSNGIAEILPPLQLVNH